MITFYYSTNEKINVAIAEVYSPDSKQATFYRVDLNRISTDEIKANVSLLRESNAVKRLFTRYELETLFPALIKQFKQIKRMK